MKLKVFKIFLLAFSIFLIGTFIYGQSSNVELGPLGGMLFYNISGTNYERAYFKWDSNEFKIGTERGSPSATARSMKIYGERDLWLSATEGEVCIMAGPCEWAFVWDPDTGVGSLVPQGIGYSIGSEKAAGLYRPLSRLVMAGALGIDYYNKYWESADPEYERAFLKWDTNIFRVGVEVYGEGHEQVLRSMNLENVGVMNFTNPVTTPTQTTDKVFMWAKDYAIDDARLYLISEQGNKIILGNNSILVYDNEVHGLAGVSIEEIEWIGSEYTLGDILTVLGGIGGTVRVTEVEDGGVYAAEVVTPGTGYTADTICETTGGTGSGCRFRVAVTTETYNAFFKWDSNVFKLGTEKSGGGVLRNLELMGCVTINPTIMTVLTDMTLGSSAVGKNLLIKATEGTELALAMTDANWTHDANWTLSGGIATHAITSGGSLTPTASMGLVTGRNYKVRFTISGITTGYITMTVGGVLGTVRDVDGIYTSYVIASGTTNLVFWPTTNFNGSISLVSVKEITEGTLSVEGLNTFAGRTILESGSPYAPAIVFSSDSYKLGIYRADGAAIGISSSNGLRHLFGTGVYRINDDAAVIQFGLSSDVSFGREAADTLALVRGANGQTLRIYNIAGANYERAYLKWDSNVFKIGTEAGGGGTVRNIQIGGSEVIVPVGGSIQAAINYAVTQTPSATNLWTVVISPGVYTEAITMSSYVNLMGGGTRGSVVIFQNAADVITLADHVEIQNLTVRTGTTGDIHTFVDGGVACTVRILDVDLESTYTGAGGWGGLYITGAGDYTLDRIYIRNTATAGGTGDQGFVLINGVAATARITNCNIYMAGAPGSTSSKSILGIIAPAAATIISSGNRYDGDAFCNTFYAESGTIISTNDSILTQYGDQIDPSASVTAGNQKLINTIANGSVATIMTNLGPTGAQATIQGWIQIKDSGGTTRYIPYW